MSTLLALAAAVSWGTASFLGGAASRDTDAIRVSLGTFLAQFVIAVVLVVLWRPEIHGPDLLWGAASGVFACLAVICLLTAFSFGRIGAVAVVSASTGASLPVIFDLIRGTRLNIFGSIGVVAALLAVVLVCLRPSDTSLEKSQIHKIFQESKGKMAVIFALLSGCGFTGSSIALDQVSVNATLWALLVMRVASLAIALGFASAKFKSAALRGMPWKYVGAIGLFYSLGDLAFVRALQRGHLALVIPVVALDTVVIVILARAVLKEHLHRRQLVGLVFAVAGVSLIGLK